jgi:hypothetical protein
MKPRLTYGRRRPSRNTEHLAWLAQGLAESSNRLEDAWWEAQLTALIQKLLKSLDDEALNQALDRLDATDPQQPAQDRAYEGLADLIETSCEIEQTGKSSRLLIALPILAWSRYLIPTRTVPAATLDALRAQLSAHVLAAGTQVHFADYLFSPDQLPQGYCQTRALAEALWQTSKTGQDLNVPASELPESQTFVSDVRYLLAVVEVPANHPVFRWNEVDGKRETALDAWRAQGRPNFQNLLTGCAYELLLPDAYFAAWRQADQENRPFALKAAADYLQTLFGVPATQLRAIVAPYFDRGLKEWRIGFTLHDSDQVVHGVTWPLLGQEDESVDIPGHIEAILKATGMNAIHILDTRMPLEYCDDCGSPLFPNPDGENVHTELPEDMQDAPAQLH